MNKDLIAAFVFGVGCFLFFVVVVPQYDAIADIRAVTKEREALLAERTAARESVRQLIKEYQARQADINKLSILLPEIKQIDQVVSSIHTTSLGAGLQLRTLTAGGSSEITAGGYKKTFIKIELGGTYPALLSFFRELEKNLRLFDVLEINIGHDPNALSPSALSFEIKMNAYNVK